MSFQDLLYEVDGAVAVVRLNRPRYRNAQSMRLLDEMDQAFERAAADDAVKVIILAANGEHFSAGHDLGTPENLADRQQRGVPSEGIGYYDNFRKYNLDYTLKWRNLSKPTIAMVRGFCIYGGWMIAAAMDLIFASEDAQFLAGLFEYFSVPWDIPIRQAKELVFESRFITAAEAHELHMVNRVLPPADLERETLAYARRVAQNSTVTLRIAKRSINTMQDTQGFSASMEAAFHDYLVQAWQRGARPREADAPRRLPGVDLALRGLRGER